MEIVNRSLLESPQLNSKCEFKISFKTISDGHYYHGRYYFKNLEINIIAFFFAL